MKKIFTYLILVVFLLGFTIKACFATGGFKYVDGGGIYTNTITLVDTAKIENMDNAM